MKNISLSLILLVFNIDNLSTTLDNIKNQLIKDWELYIIVNESLVDSLFKYQDSRINIVTSFEDSNLLNCIKYILPNLKGKYICILNNEDISDITRFDKQINYLNNTTASIVSCLHMPLYKNKTYIKNAIISNKFIDESDIDNGILGGFLSLDLYTFLIKKSFLNKINKFLFYYSFESEIDLILYFLRYTKISKVNHVLYYCREERIPYKESLYYDYNLNSTNKLVQFNLNNSLNLRAYFNEIISITSFSKKETYNQSILIILDTIKIGGTETHVLSLAKDLKKKGINSCIVTNYCLAIEEYILNDIEVKVIDFNDIETFKTTIINLCRSHNFKEINLHMCNDLSLCPLLKEITNLEITLTIHGTYYSKDMISEYSKYLTKIIFVSKFTELFYLDSINDKTECLLISNHISKSHPKAIRNYPHKLLNIPSSSKVLLYCSRLSYSKAYGGLQFLESFKELALKRKDIYAIVLGDGDSKILIDSKVKEINSLFNENRVFALGSKYNLYNFYCNSYIIIGTGRVALEALSCGTPVIALGLKGYISIVDKRHISNLIDTNFGDHCSKDYLTKSTLYSQELTDSINFLLENPKDTRALGLWSKHYCHKFLCFK